MARRRPIPVSHARHYARLGMVAACIISISLAGGVLGYHYTEKLPWIDALLNASMILGGMGPVDPVHSTVGKVFASLYALFSCFIVIGVTGVLMLPLMHHALKRFHSDAKG